MQRGQSSSSRRSSRRRRPLRRRCRGRLKRRGRRGAPTRPQQGAGAAGVPTPEARPALGPAGAPHDCRGRHPRAEQRGRASLCEGRSDAAGGTAKPVPQGGGLGVELPGSGARRLPRPVRAPAGGRGGRSRGEPRGGPGLPGRGLRGPVARAAPRPRAARCGLPPHVQGRLHGRGQLHVARPAGARWGPQRGTPHRAHTRAHARFCRARASPRDALLLQRLSTPVLLLAQVCVWGGGPFSLGPRPSHAPLQVAVSRLTAGPAPPLHVPWPPTPCAWPAAAPSWCCSTGGPRTGGPRAAQRGAAAWRPRARAASAAVLLLSNAHGLSCRRPCSWPW